MEYRQIFSFVTGILSGLTLFLFGMSTMSDSLSKMTGGRLEHVIGKITQNSYRSFLFGTVITAIVQSSSAVSVLTVGLVNSGIMELQKAAGLLIGANLGTTATAWLLSLQSIPGGSFLMELCKPSSFTPFLGIIGLALLMFSKMSKGKNIGTSLIGFVVMMVGMSIMGGSVAPLKNIPSFKNILISFSNPLLGFSFSLIFTLIIQSSDATIGILQAFNMSIGLNIGTVIPLICGAQVGTCITALLSSVDTSNNGKRTAIIQLYYNLLKNVPFLVIFYALNEVFHFEFLNYNAGAVGIPLFHTMINIMAAIMCLPVADVLVKLSLKTIPYSAKEEQDKQDTLTILDPQILAVNPSFALEQTKQAITIMAEKVQETYSTLLEGFDDISSVEEKLNVMCNRINKYKVQIIGYMRKILEEGIQVSELNILFSAQNHCKAFGRIGEIISESIRVQKEALNQFSGEGRRDIHLLMKAVGEVIDFTAAYYAIECDIFAETISMFREEVSELHNNIFSQHLTRLHNGKCKKEVGSHFLDLCYGLEKIIDACDIAAGTINTQKPDTSSSEYNDRRLKIHQLFNDKYSLLMVNESSQ